MKQEFTFAGEPFQGYAEFDELELRDSEVFEGETSSEFEFTQDGFGLRSKYENRQGELSGYSDYYLANEAETVGDSRIIDLTAQADKSLRKGVRDPKRVWALVLHQMACCFKVKDPLTRFLKMAPHFAILPDGCTSDHSDHSHQLQTEPKENCWRSISADVFRRDHLS